MAEIVQRRRALKAADTLPRNVEAGQSFVSRQTHRSGQCSARFFLDGATSGPGTTAQSFKHGFIKVADKYLAHD